METPDILLLAVLAIALTFCLGLLTGWALGKNHRRQAFRRTRAQLEADAAGWRGAYRDALGRITRHPF